MKLKDVKIKATIKIDKTLPKVYPNETEPDIEAIYAEAKSKFGDTLSKLDMKPSDLYWQKNQEEIDYIDGASITYFDGDKRVYDKLLALETTIQLLQGFPPGSFFQASHMIFTVREYLKRHEEELADLVAKHL